MYYMVMSHGNLSYISNMLCYLCGAYTMKFNQILLNMSTVRKMLYKNGVCTFGI
jgi:hypothetical protein